MHNVCMRLLSMREHSRLELCNKLKVKGFAQDEIQEVLDGLVNEGWQSDQRFAESFIRQRIQKGYGPIRIEYDLKQRGIDSVSMDEILQETSISWIDSLETVYLKKYSSDSSLSHKEWAKRARFLCQRGFSGEMIRVLFKRLKISLK